jgi:serine/threonine-protein kinase
MGVVAEATHLQLDERVALKFLRTDVAAREDITQRFAQEARACAKLKSEHVARVLDVGSHLGTPFMVMEFLDGRDLRAVLDTTGPLSVVDACELIIHACDGLGEAHARGIIHRDVKPENIFVVEHAGDRVAKILDFGVSKVALTGRLTDVETRGHTQGVMGSPYYMSPEQLRQPKDVDHRTDLWSLGAVLFEALTGNTAFIETDEFTELVVDILEKPHRRIDVFRRDVPVGLQNIIDRCLTKDRAARYQSTAELAIELAPFVRSRARAVASRVVSIATAAGFAQGLAVPESMPPPSSSVVPETLNQHMIPVAAPPPRDLSPASALPPAPQTLSPHTPHAATMSTIPASSMQPAPKSKWWLFVPIGLLVLTGALAWGAMSSRNAPTPDQPAFGGESRGGLTSEPAAPANAAGPQVSATASATASAATVEPSGKATTSAPHVAPHLPHVGGPIVAKPGTTGAAATAAPPANTGVGTSLDIRRER